MAEPATTPPRKPEAVKADLRRLRAQREDAQNQLCGLLLSIDAIDDVLDAKVGELSRALAHPEDSRA